MGSTTSDAGSATSPAKTDGTEAKPLLNSREEDLFKIAMLKCLKSGEPVIDMEKFFQEGNFNTLKTAQNTWGRIKSKVFAKKEGAEGENGAATPKTLKTPKPSSPKKRKAAEANGNDDEQGSGSPKKKKTPAKRSPKKKVVAKSDQEEAGEEVINGEEETAVGE